MKDRAFARAIFAATLVWPVTAVAGPIADRASEAEQLLNSAKPAEALAAFDEAEAAFWTASPLQMRTALFADSATGLGNYTPRAEASFKPGDKMLVYLEPVGYAFAADGDLFKVSLAVDVEIRSPGGIVFGKAGNFAQLLWSSRAKMHEIHATVATGVPTLKPGEYLLVLTIRDQASPKTASVTLPFRVVSE
jgi:hypothetical protein